MSTGPSDDPNELIEQIAEMLDSGDFDWAEDTLEGIAETVGERDTVTPKQREAVANIARSRGWEF